MKRTVALIAIALLGASCAFAAIPAVADSSDSLVLDHPHFAGTTTNFEFGFAAVPARKYWIQTSKDLVQWQTVAKVVSSGTRASIDLAGFATGRAGSFRALTWPIQKPAPLQTDDLFAPYINRVPPSPAVLGVENRDGIQITRCRFECVEGEADGSTGKSQIYAVFARPAPVRGRKLPAILICHGGGGSADETIAVGWARDGFVALACDFPGYMNQTNSHSISRMIGAEPTSFLYRVQPAPFACSLFDSVAAGLGAFNLLASQTDVDPTKIGITGYSWGGYMTCMLCGLLDTRVRAGFSLFGSGFYGADTLAGLYLAGLSEDDRALWLRAFDAGARIARVRAHLLLYAASDDFFFRPPSILATFDAIPGPKELCFSPNDSHAISLPGGTANSDGSTWTEMEPAFFSFLYSDSSQLLPSLVVEEGDTRHPKFIVNDSIPQTTYWAFYSEDVSDPWSGRQWKRIPVSDRDNKLVPAIPPQAHSFDWFGGLSFTLSASNFQRRMSLSTPIFSHRE